MLCFYENILKAVMRMKTLYLECNTGAAGDMLMSALLELHNNPSDFIDRLNKSGIPGVKISRKSVTKCGISGTGIDVFIDGAEEDEHMHKQTHEHTHEHMHHHCRSHSHAKMDNICEIINGLFVSEKVKKDALNVYTLIAEAESHVHGMPVSDIHFHEVGTMDAVADIVGVCMLIEELAPEKIIASPIHVGSGFVHCAHGILPVPAPATARLLRGIPIYGGEIDGELCTPTGAALLRYFAEEFTDKYSMAIEKIGCGMGKKCFHNKNGDEILSAVRAMLGNTSDRTDEIIMLSCNIDDMTGEQIGFASEQLASAGALDVFTAPVYMKKNRPGILLTVICKPNDRRRMAELIFKHTTTIGIREVSSGRYVLEREMKTAPTNYGETAVKHSSGYGVNRVKAEYESLKKIAIDNNISISDIKLD